MNIEGARNIKDTADVQPIKFRQRFIAAAIKYAAQFNFKRAPGFDEVSCEGQNACRVSRSQNTQICKQPRYYPIAIQRAVVGKRAGGHQRAVIGDRTVVGKCTRIGQRTAKCIGQRAVACDCPRIGHLAGIDQHTVLGQRADVGQFALCHVLKRAGIQHAAVVENFVAVLKHALISQPAVGDQHAGVEQCAKVFKIPIITE